MMSTKLEEVSPIEILQNSLELHLATGNRITYMLHTDSTILFHCHDSHSRYNKFYYTGILPTI